MRRENYLDLGFDEFLRMPVVDSRMISANDMDAFNDIAESSIRSNKLRDEAIINSKIEDLAVDDDKINDIDWTKIDNILVKTADIENLAVTNGKINNLNVSKLVTGVMTAVASVGNSYVKIDGGNKRIIINDGTNDRILIGYLAGKF